MKKIKAYKMNLLEHHLYANHLKKKIVFFKQI
jgi:hypothetical protein